MPSDRATDESVRVRARLLGGGALAGLGSVVACGCLLPFFALVVVALVVTYGGDFAWLAVIAILLVIGLVARLVRPPR